MSALRESLWEPVSRAGALRYALRPPLLLGEGLFRLGVSLRDLFYQRGWKTSQRAPIPIVSIGGIEVGGVGKTPLTLELLRIAAAQGLRPAVLSRGYGAARDSGREPGGAPEAGKWKDAVRVPIPLPPAAAEIFGDEPVWLAEEATGLESAGIWISASRIRAARAAAKAGAGLALLDDGLQHRSLHRDGEVVCLSGRFPFGNGHLLPAGPLRETPRCALARADRVVLSSVDAADAAVAGELVRPLLRPGAPIFSWHGEPALRAVIGDPPSSGESVRLLAGIAHPERLGLALAGLGHPVLESRLFPDHHRFRPAELRKLIPTARRGERPPALVTTEKDWVRLRSLLSVTGMLEAGALASEAPLRIALLRQTLVWNEPEAESSWAHWFRQLSS